MAAGFVFSNFLEYIGSTDGSKSFRQFASLCRLFFWYIALAATEMWREAVMHYLTLIIGSFDNFIIGIAHKGVAAGFLFSNLLLSIGSTNEYKTVRRFASLVRLLIILNSTCCT